MSVRTTIPEFEGIFFITMTCAQWINLFEIVDGYGLVYKWFDYLKSKRHYILGYVIMPNHLHALFGFRNTAGRSINSIIGNGKRFMAYEIVDKLVAQGEFVLLDELSQLVNKTDRRRGKLHEVFEPSFDWKECTGVDFIEQKLNYIHENPCESHWRLADSPEDYLHSSAKFYETGEQGIYVVTNYIELEDIDLTKP